MIIYVEQGIAVRIGGTDRGVLMETGERKSDVNGGAASVRRVDVLLSATAAVSWALIGMAVTAAFGLHLLGADAAGSLGPMTAAVVALAAGGSVTPSGDVSAFGLEGAQADTAIDIAPLGVGLVGALLLARFFLRSLRGAGVATSPGELCARVGTVVVVFPAMLGGLTWAGHDVVTIDGGSLGLDELPVGDLPGGLDGTGDGLGLGDISGLLPDRLGDLADAKASVGFTVDTAPTLLGGAVWVACVLLIALLASRRTPLPRGWDAVHRVVRPAASALVDVLLVAVAAGLAAAVFAMIGDDHPRRIAGAALLGTPNGVWLGIPLGLFVPWEGRATGAPTKLLPDPLDDLLRVSVDEPVTLGRLAELHGAVWLLGVGAAAMMLCAGVIAAARTPLVGGVSAAVGTWPLGAVGADGSVGRTGGAGAGGAGGTGGAGGAGTDPVRRRGGAGALGFAGRCALRLGVVTALGLPLLVWLTDVSVGTSVSVLGSDAFDAGIKLHGRAGTALLLGAAWGAGAGAAGALLAYTTGSAGTRVAPLALGGRGGGSERAPEHTYPQPSYEPGPYNPSSPYRPWRDETNPYLRPPDGAPRPPHDMYSAPTVMGPIMPPPPRAKPQPRGEGWPPPPPPPEEGPPPPGAPGARRR